MPQRGLLEGQMLLVVATWQGKGCWESQAGRARAAGHRTLAGQGLLVVASWQGKGCWESQAARAWLHVLVSVRAAHGDCKGDSAVRLLRSLRSLRARFRLAPAVTEVPQMATLRGQGLLV